MGARRKRVKTARVVLALDPPTAAKLARLHHITDDRAGITRHKARSGFDYRRPDGSLLRDLETLQRIKSLVIPPAWSAVWISPDPLGHIQVTGRDQRGRKQYRYHPRWREVRDESKYGKMLTFARVLPLIRRTVDADLRLHGLPCERVLAAIVRLLELTLFRVGNSEYTRANGSFGLTTLRDRHAHIQGSHIQLSFRGNAVSSTKPTSMIRVWHASSRRVEIFPGTSCSSISMIPASGIRSAQPRSMRICMKSPTRRSPPRISGHGQEPRWPRSPCASSSVSTVMSCANARLCAPSNG
jgi:Eukaryotic DNA topoisomerase I, catalytic core